MSDTCGYTFMGRDGIEQPCGKPVTGHRWYQHVSHEDMLGPACERHRNVGGDRLHAAEAENARLREGLDDLRKDAEVAASLGCSPSEKAPFRNLARRCAALLNSKDDPR